MIQPDSAFAAIIEIEPMAVELRSYWREYVGADSDESLLHCLAIVRVGEGKYEEVAFDAWQHNGRPPVAERVNG